MPLEITEKVKHAAKSAIGRSGNKFYQLFERQIVEIFAKRDEFEQCLKDNSGVQDALVLLTTHNLEIYARLRADLLNKPARQNRGRNGLYEQAVAMKKNVIVSFVFDILLLDTMAPDLLGAVAKSQGRAEASDFWANEIESPVSKWECRDNGMTRFFEDDTWYGVVQLACALFLEELVDAVNELEEPDCV